MTADSHSAFPELQRFFTAYLHEDALLDGTPEAALRTFWADANREERRRFRREAERFLTQTATLDLEALRELMHQLGSRWIPSSREAVTALLGVVGVSSRRDDRSP